MQFFKKTAPFYNLTLFYIIISIILRAVLMVHPITQSNFEWIDIIKIFVLGMLSDFFVFSIAHQINHIQA